MSDIDDQFAEAFPGVQKAASNVRLAEKAYNDYLDVAQAKVTSFYAEWERACQAARQVGLSIRRSEDFDGRAIVRKDQIPHSFDLIVLEYQIGYIKTF